MFAAAGSPLLCVFTEGEEGRQTVWLHELLLLLLLVVVRG
jgi:hypothetical protein